MAKTIDDLLIVASRIGDVYKVERLLAAGANVHARDDRALRLASRWGLAGVVDHLIKAGADVHAAGDLALRDAIENGHAPVVELLRRAMEEKTKKNTRMDNNNENKQKTKPNKFESYVNKTVQEKAIMFDFIAELYSKLKTIDAKVDELSEKLEELEELGKSVK
jgi:ankyrin repeat protein